MSGTIVSRYARPSRFAWRGRQYIMSKTKQKSLQRTWKRFSANTKRHKNKKIKRSDFFKCLGLCLLYTAYSCPHKFSPPCHSKFAWNRTRASSSSSRTLRSLLSTGCFLCSFSSFFGPCSSGTSPRKRGHLRICGQIYDKFFPSFPSGSLFLLFLLASLQTSPCHICTWVHGPADAPASHLARQFTWSGTPGIRTQ